MVYIHGGGLATGAGSESRYNGQTLAIEQNVIVVTLNYRLGYLGFLSLPQLTQEQGHSGNYGFLDQQMALSWVNKNIESFGGNPNQITLFGESAGANSTCLHLASPLSQDLFHNAILQSQGLYSSCANTLLTQQQGESLGETFSEIANCQEDTLACLRKKSIFSLNLSLLLKGFPMGPIHASDALPLRPVIDNYFITQQPMTSFKQGLASHKNILMGVNKNESTLFASFDDEIKTKDQYHTALNNRYPQLQTRLKALYPYEDYENGHEALADLAGDEAFVCRSIQLTNQLSMAGSQVYFYHFTQTVDSYIDSVLTLFGGNGMALGTFHASEIPYVFGIDSIFGSVNDDAQKTMNLIQDYWGDFSRTGQPSNSQTLIDWPPYNQNDKNILEISQQPLIREDLKPEKCLLWNNKPT
jgi:para-nitrobenzyl esterase